MLGMPKELFGAFVRSLNFCIFFSGRSEAEQGDVRSALGIVVVRSNRGINAGTILTLDSHTARLKDLKIPSDGGWEAGLGQGWPA
jgi:hypothetical protein